MCRVGEGERGGIAAALYMGGPPGTPAREVPPAREVAPAREVTQTGEAASH